MKEMLDNYDLVKLHEAKRLVNEVYQYNFTPSSQIAKKLDTVIRKLSQIIEQY